MKGRCGGCGDYVTIDVPPDGHTRTRIGEHGPILCGLVTPDAIPCSACGREVPPAMLASHELACEPGDAD